MSKEVKFCFHFLGDRLQNGLPYAIGPLSVCPVCLSVGNFGVCCAGIVWWLDHSDAMCSTA